MAEDEAVRVPGGPRRKGATGLKPWLVITASGQSHLEEVGKHSIMRRTGLPARDLRVLDPALSYPSTILGRERAIVINLEHIRAVITAAEVLVLNSKDPLVAPFVHDLLNRVSESNGTPRRASALEKQAYPALDELTSKISSLNLDRVRQIKSRLVAISGRVQKVRDELEHLLDDDADMAEMYLTDKLVQQSMDGISSRDELVQDEINSDEARDEESDSNNGKNITGVESSRGFKLDIEDLEMLLEAYFVQIDGTLNKLSALREYVDDTEDYINIMLDDKQNQLLQMGVMLTTATLIANAGIVVVGLFGMNIHISLFDAGMAQFMQATCGTIGACGVLYVMAIGWGKRNGLLA
ncbi:magnesium transporter MRS2-E isoform X3 [Amborella trichopoda]|uniref:magnesium transporter MRS2-E isoform X3 n=1 Tax=Amborella trichopoda TaxID=13333 RepID=UPI0009C151EE|nr:magnesium transporter MRS2-E isoform X3 [Amborella trichopoda]|eukprot:XP_020524485.1 magnesium transporter MRS2-E isoform X3 [Amborella trichopoda]